MAGEVRVGRTTSLWNDKTLNYRLSFLCLFPSFFFSVNALAVIKLILEMSVSLWPPILVSLSLSALVCSCARMTFTIKQPDAHILHAHPFSPTHACTHTNAKLTVCLPDHRIATKWIRMHDGKAISTNTCHASIPRNVLASSYFAFYALRSSFLFQANNKHFYAITRHGGSTTWHRPPLSNYCM